MIAIVLTLAVGAQDRIDVKPAADFAITGVALLGTGITELLKGDLTPAKCRWCDANLNGVDSYFHDAMTGWILSPKTADTVSTVLDYAVFIPGAFTAASLATGPYATEGAGWRASLIVAESAAVASAVVQATKFVTARQRPFARYGSATYDTTDPDSRLSFPSGHTALAASLGFSTAMTAQLQESPAAPWLWAAAGVGTVVMGSLRIIAEKHYFTDTLTGAAVGGACGVVIPLLHKRGGPLSSPTVSVAGQGATFAVSGSF